MSEFNVAATLKVFIEDPSKMEEVKSAIKEKTHVRQFSEEDVGFGIKVLKESILMNDSEGGMDQLEEKIKEVPNVSQVEVEEVGRL